jgi:transcriptional regulator with XRE-family HTH domain
MEATARKRRLAQDPERVYRMRVKAGLQQKDLAELAQIKPQMLSRIELGQAGATPPVLSRLAAALRCEITDLMPPEEVAA